MVHPVSVSAFPYQLANLQLPNSSMPSVPKLKITICQVLKFVTEAVFIQTAITFVCKPALKNSTYSSSPNSPDVIEFKKKKKGKKKTVLEKEHV